MKFQLQNDTSIERISVYSPKLFKRRILKYDRRWNSIGTRSSKAWLISLQTLLGIISKTETKFTFKRRLVEKFQTSAMRGERVFKLKSAPFAEFSNSCEISPFPFLAKTNLHIYVCNRPRLKFSAGRFATRVFRDEEYLHAIKFRICVFQVFGMSVGLLSAVFRV